MAKFVKDHYGKILIPMVTPFREDDSVDYEKAAALAEFIVQRKKGDTLVLSRDDRRIPHDEFRRACKALRDRQEQGRSRIPLIAGVGAASTIETIKLAKKAEELGFETVMIVAPITRSEPGRALPPFHARR